MCLGRWVIELSIHRTVSPKRKYRLLLSWVLKTEEGQMESRCATPTNEFVQTGPSLILKFKEMATLFLCRHLLGFQNEAWSSLDQLATNSTGIVAHPILFLKSPWLLSIIWLRFKRILSFGGYCIREMTLTTGRVNTKSMRGSQNSKFPVYTWELKPPDA